MKSVCQVHLITFHMSLYMLICSSHVNSTCDMKMAYEFEHYHYHCNFVTLELYGSLMFWPDIGYLCAVLQADLVKTERGKRF